MIMILVFEVVVVIVFLVVSGVKCVVVVFGRLSGLSMLFVSLISILFFRFVVVSFLVVIRCELVVVMMIGILLYSGMMWRELLVSGSCMSVVLILLRVECCVVGLIGMRLSGMCGICCF